MILPKDKPRIKTKLNVFGIFAFFFLSFSEIYKFFISNMKTNLKPESKPSFIYIIFYLIVN